MDALRGRFFPGQLQQLLDSVWLLLPAGYHWTHGTKMGVPTVKMWVEIYVILWKIHETALTTEKVFLPYVLWTANANQTFLPQIIRPTMLGLADAAPGGEYYDSGEYYEYYDRQATYAKMDAEKGEKR